MAIKNKDGSAYKLSTPNPLTKDQDLESLKNNEIVLHNFKWEESNVDDIPEMASVLKKDVEEQAKAEEKVEEKVEEPEEIIEVKTISVEKPVVTEESKYKVTVSIYCLPAKIKEIQDNFYGEVRQRRSFGKKFSFEAIMIEASDLSIRFWTTINFLAKGSVVFPYRYSDGQPYQEYRWWEITSVESKSGGFIVNAAVSNLQPDFT